MIWKAIILLSIALCVLGDGHHAISEQRIKIIHKKEQSKEHHGHHGELSHIGSKKPEHHEEYAWSYPSYEFSYKVHDPHTHDMKGQHESRQGDEVKGEYWLVQPDGRKRTVTYHADKHSGFHATVHYSGDHKLHHEPPKVKEEKSEEGGEGEQGEEGEGGEEGGEAEEAEEGGSEEDSSEEEGEEGGAEESRGREEQVGKWIHDRFWGHRNNDKHRERKHHDNHKNERRGEEKRREEPQHDSYHMIRGDEKRRDEHRRDNYHMVRGDEKQRQDDDHKHRGAMSIFTGLGSYSPRYGRERAEWHGHDDRRDRDESREESRGRPEHRGLDNPIKQKMAPIVRENYYHPRYYRQNQQKRKIAKQ